MANDIKWIKIATNIFDDEAFKLIDALPEADAIELIWFKLLVYAGASNNNGIFLYKDKIAYTDEMLSAIFHRPLATVRLALNTFEQFGMIERIDDVYTIPNWSKHQTLDAYEKKKERDRLYQQNRREKAKLEIEEKVEQKKSSDNRLTVGRICSYSYSFNINNNNTVNYRNILESKNYKYYIYIKDNPDVESALADWFDYKDKCKPRSKHQYKTEKAMCNLLTQVVNKCQEIGKEKVIEQINLAMSKNWQGINLDKISVDIKDDTNIFADMYPEAEKEFKYTFETYPKHANYRQTALEWKKVINCTSEPRNVSKRVYQAIQAYVREYEKQHKEDADHQYIKSLDNFIKDDLEYWLGQVTE